MHDQLEIDNVRRTLCRVNDGSCTDKCTSYYIVTYSQSIDFEQIIFIDFVTKIVIVTVGIPGTSGNSSERLTYFEICNINLWQYSPKVRTHNGPSILKRPLIRIKSVKTLEAEYILIVPKDIL